MEKPYLSVKNMSKAFPGVKALDNVSIDAYQGEALALIGVNGAGKSTLMNVLAGEIQADEGVCFINQKEITVGTQRDAETNGIALIHQEPIVFPALSVAENVLINRLNDFKTNGVLSYKALYAESKIYLDMVGCDIHPKTKVEDVTVGGRQLIEIARALSQGASIMLFDEPTSSLTIKEKRQLFSIIDRLKKEKKTIIYITHFIEEVIEVCERATIMMNGRVTGNRLTKDIPVEEFIRLMVGESVQQVVNQNNARSVGDVILHVENLTRFPRVSNVSFDMKRGEILGLWGLLGSGRSEILRALFGLDHPDSGTIQYRDELGAFHSLRGKALLNRAGYVPENRHVDGLYMTMPLWKNVTMANLGKFAHPLLNEEQERQESRRLIGELQVKTTDETVTVEKLSGGNQQKIVLARGICKKPSLFFMDEPTRGVDVGAKAEIHKLILQLAEQGCAVLIVSSEIEEIINLCDRVLIVNNGSLTNEVDKSNMTKHNLMALCIGEEEEAG